MSKDDLLLRLRAARTVSLSWPDNALVVIDAEQKLCLAAADRIDALNKLCDELRFANADAADGLRPSTAAAPAETWQWVPKEPTPEMLQAAMDDLDWWCKPQAPSYDEGTLVDPGLTEEDAAHINGEQMEAFASAMKAAFAAAPPASGTEEKA